MKIGFFKIYFGIIQIIILSSFSFNEILAQKEDYDYENWPGKDGTIKTNIIISDQLVKDYKLLLSRGSNDTIHFYEFSDYENDNIKKGRVDIRICSNVEKAQLALVDYLECFTNPIKPPRLTFEDFNAGDVAFGENIYEAVYMAFTRNNVLVILRTTHEKVKVIALDIDKSIQDAPVFEEDSLYPSFK